MAHTDSHRHRHNEKLFSATKTIAGGRRIAMSLSHPTAVNIQMVYTTIHKGCGAEDKATIMITLIG